MTIHIYFKDNNDHCFSYNVDKITSYIDIQKNRKFLLLTRIVDEIENYVHIPIDIIEKIEVE